MNYPDTAELHDMIEDVTAAPESEPGEAQAVAEDEEDEEDEDAEEGDEDEEEDEKEEGEGAEPAA